MKQSGYRTAFHIYLIFFLSLFGTLIVAYCLFAMLITTPNSNGKNVRSDQPKIFTQDFSEYIVFINDTPQIKQAGIELLQETHVGLQIIDAAGNEVYAYQKPDNAQSYYSNTDLLLLDHVHYGCFINDRPFFRLGQWTICNKSDQQIISFYWGYLGTLLSAHEREGGIS